MSHSNHPIRVLLVASDGVEPEVRRIWQLLGRPADRVEDGLECVNRLRIAPYDAVIAVEPLAGWSAAELLEETRLAAPAIPFFVWNPGGSAADAVRLIKLGANHYFSDPIDEDDFARQIDAAGRPVAKNADEPWRQWLVGESRPMERVCEMIRLAGPRRATVLITGETGTGKECVARALHAASDRSKMPFVAVNCHALPENLLEAELFGHVKGAFTGAMQGRIGRFEQAHRGTLFLDEIGDMPLDLQAKLLRVLQEREFQRLGSSETVRVDVRVVAATNARLEELVAEGIFREDLYYRLHVIPIRVPPLRERRQDIALLARHFLEKVCQAERIPRKSVAPEVLDHLSRFAWPGNVRQLENSVEMAVALSGDRQTLYAADFPFPAGVLRNGEAPGIAPPVALPEDGLDFEETVSQFERQILKQALARTAGNKKQAAEMLRLKRTTLSAKWKLLEASA